MSAWWRGILYRITPASLKDQLVAADVQLDGARAQFTAVVERDQDVDRLTAEHRIDRARNHYGERIATALGGRTSWT